MSSWTAQSEWFARPTIRSGIPGAARPIVEAAGARVGVLNLSGAVQLRVARSPFAEADAQLAELADDADAVIVDFHAEVTSEKVAMGWHLDGRVAACLGTHTHVPTADARDPAGRHGVHQRRRHDGLARGRDRGPARAGPGGASAPRCP